MRPLENKIHEALGEPGTEEAVCELLRRFLGQVAEEPQRHAARWHPLGFLHLAPLTGTDALRIHVWSDFFPVAAHAAPSRIHDHVWRLNSQVVMGELVNVLLEVVPAGVADATHRTGAVRYDGDQNAVLATGDLVRLREVSRERVGAGHRYEMPVGQIHRTEITGSRPVVTVVRARQESTVRPRVFLPLASEGYEMTRIVATDEEVRRALRGFLDAG